MHCCNNCLHTICISLHSLPKTTAVSSPVGIPKYRGILLYRVLPRYYRDHYRLKPAGIGIPTNHNRYRTLVATTSLPKELVVVVVGKELNDLWT